MTIMRLHLRPVRVNQLIEIRRKEVGGVVNAEEAARNWEKENARILAAASDLFLTGHERPDSVKQWSISSPPADGVPSPHPVCRCRFAKTALSTGLRS